MSKLTKGTLIGLTGVVFWSTTAIFISTLINSYHMRPLVLAFWRDFFVCAALLPALLVLQRGRLRMDRRNLPLFAAYGFVLSLFNAIWTLSVNYNGAAVSTVLAYGSAGFTAILAWWLFKEKLGFAKITAIIFSLSGCVLVANALDINAWRMQPIGIVVGILSGLMFAFYSLIGKETARRAVNPWAALLYSFAFAAFFLFIYNFIPGLTGTAGSLANINPRLPAVGWLLLVTLSLIPTILGYGLYTASMAYLPASIANLIATLEPTFTATQAYFLLGERLTAVQIIGSLLVIAAVVLVRLAEDPGLRRRRRTALKTEVEEIEIPGA